MPQPSGKPFLKSNSTSVEVWVSGHPYRARRKTATIPVKINVEECLFLY